MRVECVCPALYDSHRNETMTALLSSHAQGVTKLWWTSGFHKANDDRRELRQTCDGSGCGSSSSGRGAAGSADDAVEMSSFTTNKELFLGSFNMFRNKVVLLFFSPQNSVNEHSSKQYAACLYGNLRHVWIHTTYAFHTALICWSSCS